MNNGHRKDGSAFESIQLRDKGAEKVYHHIISYFANIYFMMRAKVMSFLFIEKEIIFKIEHGYKINIWWDSC